MECSVVAVVEARLGRKPRGLREVMVSDGAGQPRVIRVASIVDGKPFPTLFWLIDPDLNLRIDRAEAGGLIAELQVRVDSDAAVRESMRNDHAAHIALRESYMEPGERELLQDRGQWEALASRGIGGIADFSRIRCLHTWYAAHLVQANSIGRLLEEYWQSAASGGDSVGLSREVQQTG